MEYCRETARHVRTLHDLALRGRNKEEITRQIHQRIVEASKPPPVVRDGTAISFFASPQEFTGIAETGGLHLVRYWQHDYPNTRNNYLLRKAG